MRTRWSQEAPIGLQHGRARGFSKIVFVIKSVPSTAFEYFQDLGPEAASRLFITIYWRRWVIMGHLGVEWRLIALDSGARERRGMLRSLLLF